MHKRSIVRKISQVGFSTLVSRFLGMARETLMARYLGIGPISDAFITAFKIPNSLRKMLAEGAMSAALVPKIVELKQTKNSQDIDSFMTTALWAVQGILLCCSIILWIYAPTVIHVVAPGWHDPAIGFSRSTYAIMFLRILIPFVLCAAASALLAGALQASGKYLVPALSPALLNIILVTGICIALMYNAPVQWLCWLIVFGGVAQVIVHVIAYWQHGLRFGRPTISSWGHLLSVVGRFIPCLLGMSIMEINLFIDTSFASYLPSGTMSLIYYANRFMGIPQGVFATALATVLLPVLSTVTIEKPARLSFYLLEITKLVLWITLPVSLIMSFFAPNIFATVFLSKNFPMEKVIEGAFLLRIFLVGLFCFSLNKILLNMYYALRATTIPTVISVAATGINIILNYLFLDNFGAAGLVWATTISAIAQAFLFIIFLRKNYSVKLDISRISLFLLRYIMQLSIIFTGAYTLFTGITYAIHTYTPIYYNFWCNGLGLWLWVGPLCAGIIILLFESRKFFKIKLYFID